MPIYTSFQQLSQLIHVKLKAFSNLHTTHTHKEKKTISLLAKTIAHSMKPRPNVCSTGVKGDLVLNIKNLAADKLSRPKVPGSHCVP